MAINPINAPLYNRQKAADDQQASTQAQVVDAIKQQQSQASDAKLKQLLQGNQIASDQAMPGIQEGAKLQGLQQKKSLFDQLKSENAQADGGKQNIAVNDGGISMSQADPKPIDTRKQMSQDGMALNKLAASNFKPINDQIDASRSTLEALDQKNATSDKLALMNEAKLALGSGGARAMKTAMDAMSGNKTVGMDYQTAMNYINNTPNLPTMPDATRDAIRESVHNRLGQLNDQYMQTKQKIGQLAPAVTPLADSNAILGSYTNQIDSGLKDLSARRDAYNKARAGASNPISNPSVADDNPTTTDKLMSFFGLGGKKAAPQQASQPQAPQAAQPQSQAAQPQAGSAEPLVSVVSTDGTRGKVPASKLQSALARGFKQVQ